MQDAYCFAASLRSVLYVGPIVEQLEGVRSRRVDIGAELLQELLRDSVNTLMKETQLAGVRTNRSVL